MKDIVAISMLGVNEGQSDVRGVNEGHSEVRH